MEVCENLIVEQIPFLHRTLHSKSKVDENIAYVVLPVNCLKHLQYGDLQRPELV